VGIEQENMDIWPQEYLRDA